MKKGTVMVLVLGVILVVVVLSAVILALMVSQGRVTKHQVDRTKANYVAQAGVNYAFEMLRQGKWNYSESYKICNDKDPSCTDSSCNVCDPDLPYTVDITIGPQGQGINNTTEISATVDYTYTP